MNRDLARDLDSGDARIRLCALQGIVRKEGNQVVPLVDDDTVVALLRKALRDPDRRVRKQAALCLRPWTQRDPGLFSDILPDYAVRHFDGSYTHAGLLDTRCGDVWIAPWQALKGHAALIDDGNTDRYLKFQFYRDSQAPPALRDTTAEPCGGHIVYHLIVDWSYSLQALLSVEEDRRREANVREQERLASKVVSFYRACRLPFSVAVHRTLWEAGRPPRHERRVGEIEGHRE